MLEFLNWHFWVYLGVLLLILEIFTTSFLLACFAIGAFSSALISYFGLEPNFQLLVFSIMTIISFFTIKPFAIKYLYSTKNNVKTNADYLIGQKAKVSEEINSVKGRISIDGDIWRAVSDETIKKGEMVIIKSINSTILTVKKQ